MTTATFQKLFDGLLGEIRHYPVANAIAEYAEERKGKRIDKRDCKALAERVPGWVFGIRKESYSWADYLEMSAWRQGDWQTTNFYLRVCSTRTNPKWPSKSELTALPINVSYFEGAFNSNHRIANLTDPNGEYVAPLKHVASLIDSLALMHAELKGVLATIDERVVSNEVFSILKDLTEEEFRNL